MPHDFFNGVNWQDNINSLDYMLLSESHLYTSTRKKHHSAQVQVLNALGIRYIKRPDGSLIVSEQHIQILLGVEVNNINVKKVSPDWSVINA